MIVGLASAWGAWCGREAELPAVEAAVESLAQAALDTAVDWPAALETAFVAASRAIEELPGGERQDDESPTSCLVCAVLTTDEVVLAWLGKRVAGLVTPCGVTRELAAHTWRNKLRRELPGEEFAQVTVPWLRAALELGLGDAEADTEQWPGDRVGVLVEVSRAG